MIIEPVMLVCPLCKEESAVALCQFENSDTIPRSISDTDPCEDCLKKLKKEKCLYIKAMKELPGGKSVFANKTVVLPRDFFIDIPEDTQVVLMLEEVFDATVAAFQKAVDEGRVRIIK